MSSLPPPPPDAPPMPTPPLPDAPPRRSPFWTRWWLWAVVIVVILIAAGAASALDEWAGDAASPTPVTEPTSTPTRSPTPVEVVVPDVEGENVNAATKALAAEDLFVVVRESLTQSAREGTVLDQSVEPRSTVAVGSAVVLTVAESFPTIPHVVGDRVAAARRTLEDRGFDFREKIETSNKPRDTVIRQSPSAGTSARPGRMVLLVIAAPAPR